MEENCGKPLNGELDLINKFTRRRLSEDEVYVFPVVLCDNDIDRDNERFSDDALDKLAELFVGVTGIADHEPSSKNQTARIFMCRKESVEGKTTSDGRLYKRVYARAYIPRGEKSRELILALDSGIKKEVSVGCSVKKRICSVCGRDISVCEHIKGRKYADKLCYATLDEPTDAYEWSFVAVPAQKAAGVVKNYGIDNKNIKMEGESAMDIEKKLFSNQEQSFSAEEMQELVKKFGMLEKRAMEGEYFRDVLIKEVKGLASVALPQLSSETLAHITEELSVRQLDELKKALEIKADDILPMKPQLFKQSGTSNNNTLYKNI